MEKKQKSDQNSQMFLQSQRTSIDTNQNETPSIYLDMDYSQEVSKYNFVIGILKPGQKRIGLIAINKNKLSIAGILGIKKQKK